MKMFYWVESRSAGTSGTSGTGSNYINTERTAPRASAGAGVAMGDESKVERGSAKDRRGLSKSTARSFRTVKAGLPNSIARAQGPRAELLARDEDS